MVEPQVFKDDRGFFLETYHQTRYGEKGIDQPFVQDNHSHSRKGSIRGLHYQLKHPQGKLVYAVTGRILDVVLDIRRGSPTFGKYTCAMLSADNFRQLYVPPGLLHGFLVTSETAQVEYKCTALYRPEADFSVAWNDPDLAIPWPTETPILSAKDASAPRLREVEDRLVDF